MEKFDSKSIKNMRWGGKKNHDNHSATKNSKLAFKHAHNLSANQRMEEWPSRANENAWFLNSIILIGQALIHRLSAQ